MASEPILDVFLRFGEGDTPTTTLFMGTEGHYRVRVNHHLISLSPFFTWLGVVGLVENEVKGGREVAGTEWLLFTLLFMMFSTIFWRDLPCGKGGGLAMVFKGILQNTNIFLTRQFKLFSPHLLVVTGLLVSTLSTPLSLSEMKR